MKKEELIEFIEWMTGSLSPISHPDFYELNITDNNFIYQIEHYFETQRKKVFKHYGKTLIDLIKIILEEYISKEEFEQLRVSKDDFNFEFGGLLAIFKDTEEGDFLLKIVHEKLLEANDKLFYLEMLSYLNNHNSIKFIEQLQFKLLSETELIYTIDTLYEIGTTAAQTLIKKIGNLEYLKKYPLFMEAFRKFCT